MPQFLYSSASYGPLSQNALHQFAARHALVHYPSGAVSTYIPKNACSSLRLSLALANGCISDPSQYNWIHNNNETFIAHLSDLVRAPYTFVFLRCPYMRLASAYLDKIVGHTVEAWQFLEFLHRDLTMADLTFERFVQLLKQPTLRFCNEHWRPQVNFLVYSNYDDYFNITDMNKAAKIIQTRCGLNLVNAQNFTRHGRDQLIVRDDFEKPHTISPIDFLKMKEYGELPSIKSLYTKELREIVREVYDEDIRMISEKLGKSSIVF